MLVLLRGVQLSVLSWAEQCKAFVLELVGTRVP
jgi:hypothetical protein